MSLTGLLVYILIGLLAGALSGLFGIGGGLVIVPGLVYLAGFSQHRATGTSLAALLLPIGLGAVIEYHKRGHTDFRAAAVLALVLFGSAWVSAHFANKISETTLKMAFGVFVTLVGIYIILSTYYRWGK